MIMDTLQIKKENAVSAFKAADQSGKKLLTNLFGKKVLSEKITDWIGTFSDIIELAGEAPENYNLRPGETDDELAYRQAKLVADVLNEGTILDPFDTNQYKYFPYAKIDKSSGFGLSCNGYDSWHTNTTVGVRLCLKSADLAEFAFKTFPDIYSRFLI
jgi:hypothetical protein